MNRNDDLWIKLKDQPTVPQKVLLVDDKPENLVALEAVLNDGVTTLLKANSGEAALQFLLHHDDIALVLLDIAMPGMDGFEVADMMRGTQRTRNIPIIFLTAFMRDESATLRGYKSGAVDYVYKPFNATVLRCKVSVFLELNRQQHQLIHAYRRLDNQREYFESILDAAGEGVIGLNQQGQIDFANPAALTMLGLEAGKITEKEFSRFCVLPDALEFIDYLLRRVLDKQEAITVEDGAFRRFDGALFSISCVVSPLAGHSNGAVLVFQDISQRKALEEQLRIQAHTDSLTGLHNRHSFKQLLQSALTRNSRKQRHLAVLFIDLDHFKQINDSLGHEVGDRLLQGIALELLRSVRGTDVVARLGGDEFTVLVEDMNDPEDAAVVARSVTFALARPFIVDDQGTEITVTASVGIATHPACGADTTLLMQAADLAMYRAKHKGGNQYEFFTPEMNAKAQVHLMLEQSLRRAVIQQEFRLHYQPQIDIGTGQIRGFEALIRWQHPVSGMVSPATFVPLLEETGLILQVGAWVIEAACHERAQWRDRALVPDNCTVAINLSPRQFNDRDLIPLLRRSLAVSHLEPSMLEIEITESCLMEDIEATCKLLENIKQIGIKLSIDDFGTGYSSLAYLKSFELDVLKIDRAFVKGLTSSSKDDAIAASIVQLAHNLGLKVIAEGVETLEQLNVLRQFGCDLAQGFLYSPALPAGDLGAFIHGHNQKLPDQASPQ